MIERKYRFFAFFAAIELLLLIHQTQCFMMIRRGGQPPHSHDQQKHDIFLHRVPLVSPSLTLYSTVPVSSSTRNSIRVDTDADISLKSRPIIQLKPLSYNPLLFQSTESILTPEQCSTLKQWLQSQTKQLDGDTLAKGIQQKEEGAILLKTIQHALDEVLGNKKGEDNELVVPRYLSYKESDLGGGRPASLEDYKVEDLLPDGLHVDTNNSKHFRHW